tara:strand:- start:49 stop:261 length:213 start_codon:yes stop_codon:yes gene_type:complete
MKDIDWFKVQVWLGILVLCLLFWYGIYMSGYLQHVIGFALVVLSGIFAWESTLIVDEQKRARRKRRGYDD